MNRPIRREVIRVEEEDKIITYMIVSTEFLKTVYPIIDIDYFTGQFGKTVALWCLDHYESYKTAPGRHIKDIFDKNVSQGLDPTTAELIEQFLVRISQEFERVESIDVQFAINLTTEYFKIRQSCIIHDQIGDALANGEDGGNILQLVREKSKNTIDLSSSLFKNSLTPSSDLLKEKIKIPKAYVWPWLREGSISMIYAARGVGKSWLALILSVALTRDIYQDIEIGPWIIKNPVGVLYIDGEMGLYDMQDRIRQIADPLGPESRRFPLLVFSAPDYVEKFSETVNILKTEWQDRIMEFLRNNRRIKVVVFDNLSSLTAGRDENDNQVATQITAWLIRLRSIGVSPIIVHHAGKGGDQRGASALEDPLNNTILLKRPKDEEGGACFSVKFTKARNNAGSEGYNSFTLKLLEHDENIKWRQWVQI